MVTGTSAIICNIGKCLRQRLAHISLEFLDDKGDKISKSKGNGLSMEEWLRYAPPESLALFMYQKPKAAKRLYFDVIPRNVDDYLSHLGNFEKLEDKNMVNNAVEKDVEAEPEVEEKKAPDKSKKAKKKAKAK